MMWCDLCGLRFIGRKHRFGGFGGSWCFHRVPGAGEKNHFRVNHRNQRVGWVGNPTHKKCTLKKLNNPESQGLPESFELPKSTEIWESHLMSGGEKTSQVGESNGALCGHWSPCFHIKCFWEPTSGFLKSWEYDLQLNTTWILQFQIVKIVKRISRADFFRTK